MYSIQFRSYCGMSDIPESFEEGVAARDAVAQRLRSARAQGHTVVTLESGESWEVLEPEDSQMVPDWAGTLRLSHLTYECRECGSKHETHEAALECCSEMSY